MIFDSNNSYLLFNELYNNNIVNLFTLKPFNFKSNIVNKENIDKQYDIIQKCLNISFKKIVKPCQNHTNNVVCIDEFNIDDHFIDTDGLITNLSNVALVTLVADCQSIFLYDENKHVIGNIHSGWKGTLNKIIVNAVDLMISIYNCNPDDIKVFFCPSILECCFEVDEDVKDLFINKFSDIDINSCIKSGEIKDNKQKYFIDTIRVNTLNLLEMGIKKEHIVFSSICSKCNSDVIHSYRVDGENSGRNMSLICLK